MQGKKRAMFRMWVARASVVACVVLCCGWVLGELGIELFWVDLVGALVLQCSVLAGVIGLGWWIAGWKRGGVVCVLSAVVGVWPVVSGRALFAEKAGIGGRRVLVGTVNMYPRNERWAMDFEMLHRLGLDVLVVIEVPIELSRAIRNDGYLEGTGLEHWAHRAWVEREVSPGFVLSKHPLEMIQAQEGDEFGGHELMCVVHDPEGAYVVGLMHPLSPRTVERWSAGNRVLEARRESIDRILDETGMAMIVGADLNAGRAQIRGRALRRSGLEPSKPLLVFDGGSFPAGYPGLMQIQIDDLWVSDRVRTVSWGMVGLSGSDHRAVVGGFEILPGDGVRPGVD